MQNFQSKKEVNNGMKIRTQRGIAYSFFICSNFIESHMFLESKQISLNSVKMSLNVIL